MGLPRKFTLDAEHANSSGSIAARITVRDALARRVVVHHQTRERPARRFPGHTAAEPGIRNTPREEQVLRSLEEPGVLDREWTLLGKEHLVTLVDGDLRLVGLDLTEIRVDGEVDGHRVLENSLGIKADTSGLVAGVALIPKHAICSEVAVRNRQQVSPRRDTLDPL